ncbi:hypothetical protein BGX27_011591 [Mortierella sp. AM989]|nr:hypothetical protein BGX27_011591 [Mortierella sp. AM989]
MVKPETEKITRQISKSSFEHGYLSDTPYTTGSDVASQLSRESMNGKKKGWTKSLKKATSSILYMAMPPTSADQLPMVVAQTPMSPDRLIPTLHSSLLQSPLMSALEHTPTITSTTFSDTRAANPNSYIPTTAASSTSSIASSSMTSSSSSVNPLARKGSKTEYPTSINSENSDTAPRKQRPVSTSSAHKKRTVKGKERAGSLDIAPQNFDFTALPGPTETRAPMPSTSPSSSPSARSSTRNTNGTHPNAVAPQSSMMENASQFERRQALPSPPPSPLNINRRQQPKEATPVIKDRKRIQTAVEPAVSPFEVPVGNHTKQTEVKPELTELKSVDANVLPVLPPNISRLSCFGLEAELEQASSTTALNQTRPVKSKAELQKESVKKSHATHVEESRQEAVVESPKEQVKKVVRSEPKEVPQLTTKTFTVPSIPGSFPGLPFMEPEPVPEVPLSGSSPTRPKYKAPRPPRENIANVPFPGSFPVKPVFEEPKPVLEPIAAVPEPKPTPVSLVVKERQILPIAPQQEFSFAESPVEERRQSPESAAVSLPQEPVVLDKKPEVLSRELKIEIAPQTTPSELRKQSKEMSFDAPGIPIISNRSMSLSRRLSKGSNQQKTVKNVPWLWHQDGIHHQRLESHQILTKEQVFEQFHLDLEQEGPNGFFLFKLVRRFKKQDSSLLAISSSLLDAELTASPSSSPSSSTPTSILESLEAVSVSQRLKRQLLLQKGKKQRKASNNADEGENLEALLAMTNNNSSLQNLNSSLQEVIDAVENMKQGEEWTSLLSPPHQLPQVPSQTQKPSYPDSEGEYTSRDKDAVDITTMEKKRGVYATGRLDGMNLTPKKKYTAAQRRSSVPGSGRKGSLPSNSTGADPGAQDSFGSERRGSETTDASPFRKNAVYQLHIYSRNGLKFKFDVMEDNELHFVEASKKYTFMDPLATHRQPELDINSNDSLSPLRTPTFPLPSNGRRPSNGTLSTAPDIGRPRRSGSSVSKSTHYSSSSLGSTGSRRVYVTRLGRHTLLTYPEYKSLAKSASSFTLGAKLLIQRSIAVATPNFYGNGKDSSQTPGNDNGASASPTRTNSTPTPSGNGDNTDYFNMKKKPRGFASKAVAAIKSPLTPSGATTQKTSGRAIVTPYNPNDYKNKSLTVSGSTANGNSSSGDESSPSAGASSYTPLAARRGANKPAPVAVDTNSSDSPFPLPPNHINLPSEPISPLLQTPVSASASTPTSATASTPSSSHSNPYGSIKRHGNQAGLKFQHLFVTVHQRLQKLELENGSSFYGSALVQWTVIEDPAELRWWRDKIGIQMIGRLDGDESTSPVTKLSTTTSTSHSSKRSTLSSVRASYMSSDTMLSDATSSSLSSRGYRTHVSIERLGYRFLRVSGHMGTMKVTVSEKVEARAVALAVRAEIIKQKRIAHMNQGYIGHVDEELLEHPWVETADFSVASDGESDVDGYGCDDESDNESDEETPSNGIPIGRTDKNSNFYDMYEYDEWTGRTKLKNKPSVDRFSRRKRHNRAAKEQEPLIERMTMIVGQSKVFKGDWYMKNVYKFHPELV